MEEEERTFTPGQAEAMDALLSGRNVFLSGNAGTGKSYVLNAFIEELEEREVPYLAMAPTGIAAQNLHNGTTIHWCCIIKVDTLFSRILIYNHNQYENRRKTYGTESKIL